ncbi:unnamed protein product, partial [marine sediment metagenome]
DSAPEPGWNVGAILHQGWHGFLNPTRGYIMFVYQVREHGIPVLVRVDNSSFAEVVIAADFENPSRGSRFALFVQLPSAARRETNYAFTRSVQIWVPTDVDRLNAFARIMDT